MINGRDRFIQQAVGPQSQEGADGKVAAWRLVLHESSAHGAGFMLVPVLMPLCSGDAADREISTSGSLTLALAAVGIHTAAMIAVIAVSRGFDVVVRPDRSFQTSASRIIPRAEQGPI